jgi:hypothetical protein
VEKLAPVISNQALQASLPEESVVDEVVHSLSIYRKTWSDEDYSLFLRCFNKFLEVISPVQYDPLLIERLGVLEPLPLWGLNYDEELLRNTLLSILNVKYKPGDQAAVSQLRKQLVDLLELLGIEDPEEVVSTCDNTRVVEKCLVHASVIVLIKATNP